MKDTLKELFDKLGNSEPIFVLDDDREYLDEIVLKVKEQYAAEDHIEDKSDPVERIMAYKYREYFNRERKRFVIGEYVLDNARTDIYSRLKKLYVNTSTLKKPSHSKLYNFMDNFDVSDLERQELIVSLFRYVSKHVDGNNCFTNKINCPHAKNFLAILEAMKDKYERV